MLSNKIKVGIIGCGNISPVYFRAGKRFESIEIKTCGDLITERAEARAREFGIPEAATVEKLLADPEIKIVLNLTLPAVHSEIALAALKAGKNIYNEKPLAITREAGR
ncbi:MAG: Gfo/Idh/MocA family oxidoreductase, partial [Planctomycetota bacterium]